MSAAMLVVRLAGSGKGSSKLYQSQSVQQLTCRACSRAMTLN
jgi:hypothetical protein